MLLKKSLDNTELLVSGVYPSFAKSDLAHELNYMDIGARYRPLPRVARALLAFSRYRERDSEHSWNLYSGVYAPLAVRRSENSKNVLYCHTPPGFAFDQYGHYLERSNLVQKNMLKLAIPEYRRRYLASLAQMDVIITNSEYTKNRLSELTGCNSIVINPPVELLGAGGSVAKDYYLSIARLEPAKRVDLLIKAFKTLPHLRLLIASGGSEEGRLRDLAGRSANITFTGWLPRKELASLIKESVACLYIPAAEDFGISVVEALSAGKPVLAAAGGGPREIIEQMKTGYLVPQVPSLSDICKGIEFLDSQRCKTMAHDCERVAQEYTHDIFLKEMSELLDS